MVFITNEDVSLGVWLYEFNSKHINDNGNWCKLEDNWYVNVKKYAEFYKEEELVDKILTRIGSVLK